MKIIHILLKIISCHINICMRVEVNYWLNSMDGVVKVIPHIYRIVFTHRSTGNFTGDILTVNIRCASGGFLLFEKLYFYWGCLAVILSLSNYNFLKLTDNGTGYIDCLFKMCFWWLHPLWGIIFFLIMSVSYLLFDEFYYLWECKYWFVLNELKFCLVCFLLKISLLL